MSNLIKAAIENNFIDFKTEIKTSMTDMYTKKIQSMKDEVNKSLLSPEKPEDKEE